MRSGLILAVCLLPLIGTGSVARAQIIQVPQAYAIPLPPVLQPQFEVGIPLLAKRRQHTVQLQFKPTKPGPRQPHLGLEIR
jgi:hypothetical protein